MADVDVAVLGAIGDILTPDLVDDVIVRVRELVEHPRRPGDSLRERIETELEAVTAQIANLTDAIAMGGDMPVLVARLQEAERTRLALATRATALGDGLPVVRVDWRATERQARRRLADWRVADASRHRGSAAAAAAPRRADPVHSVS
jgi:hypothetical protein